MTWKPLRIGIRRSAARLHSKDIFMRKRQPKVLAVKPAGPDHQVITVAGGGGGYRRKPCSDCPWRRDAVGEFPAEAFRHSARTAYDMAEHLFSCHQSGKEKPAICAGFLLRGADHNLTIRIGRAIKGNYRDVSDGGLDLFENYREMATANGVDPDDPVLSPCRD